MRRFIVVGGGIAGLVAARRLAHVMSPSGTAHVNGAGAVRSGGHTVLAAADDTAEVVVLEAMSRVGGRIRTEHDHGFILEAGADSFLATKPAALRLATELGLGGELRGTRPSRHRAFVRRDGRSYPLPDGLSGLVPGSAAAILRARMLSWPGRLRALLDLVLPGRLHPAEEESIAAFARRRFGSEAYDWLIEPLLAGIHGGDGEKLGICSTFPALAAAAQAGSVIRGAHAVRRHGSSGDDVEGRAAIRGSTFVTLAGGMQRLVDAIVAQPAFDIRCSTAVEAVERNGRDWQVVTANGGTVHGDAIILALPAHAAACIVAPVSTELATLLAGIPFASSIVVHAAWTGIAIPRTLEGHGYLNPRRSGRRIVACTFSSSKFDGRAPSGGVLVRGFLKGHDIDDLTDADAIDALLAEARDVLGITAPPRLVRVYRHPDGMPQYVVGHAQRIVAIDNLLGGLPGLHLTGNSYRGVGIADTVAAAESCASAVLAAARFRGAPVVAR